MSRIRFVNRTIEALHSAPANTRLYVGADSVRYQKGNRAFAKITVVSVIHLAGSKGCRVIPYVETREVFDKNLGRPQHRMMTEAMLLSEVYLLLEEALIESDLLNIPVEIHLDIASDKQHGSNCAAKQAAGYIMGTCNIEPKLKPEAWAASTAADLAPKKLKNVA